MSKIEYYKKHLHELNGEEHGEELKIIALQLDLDFIKNAKHSEAR